MKDMIEKVNTALEYFKATGNPFPYFTLVSSRQTALFCQSLGIELPSEEDCKIPEGWKPAE